MYWVAESIIGVYCILRSCTSATWLLNTSEGGGVPGQLLLSTSQQSDR